jgi:antitoxin component YwqK of YwqJK toxin-antitoxin module
MKLIWFATTILSAVFLAACTEPEQTPAPPAELEGFALEELPGQTARLAKRLDENGNLLEIGPLENNQKTGTWVEYDAEKGLPIKVVSYWNGLYNGAYLELNTRGQVELKAHYRNNKLHGPWTKYRFGGRVEAEANYVDGKLDGLYREYYAKGNKVKEEVTYRTGIKDGPYRYYNEDGELALEYEYRDGEKVSGGLIE